MNYIIVDDDLSVLYKMCELFESDEASIIAIHYKTNSCNDKFRDSIEKLKNTFFIPVTDDDELIKTIENAKIIEAVKDNEIRILLDIYFTNKKNEEKSRFEYSDMNEYSSLVFAFQLNHKLSVSKEKIIFYSTPKNFYYTEEKFIKDTTNYVKWHLPIERPPFGDGGIELKEKRFKELVEELGSKINKNRDNYAS